MEQQRLIVLIADNTTSNPANIAVIEQLNAFDKILLITSGKAAISYFEGVKQGANQLPDVVLLYIKLADYDGVEIMEEIEEMELPGKEDMKLYLLACNRHKKDLAAYSNMHMAKACLEIPLKIDELEEAVC